MSARDRSEERASRIRRKIREIAGIAAELDEEQGRGFDFYADTVNCPTCKDIGRILRKRMSPAGYEAVYGTPCPDCEKGEFLERNQDKPLRDGRAEAIRRWTERQRNKPRARDFKQAAALDDEDDDLPF